MATVICNTCMGEGEFKLPRTNDDCTNDRYCDCPTCNGSGKVWKEEHKKKK